MNYKWKHKAIAEEICKGTAQGIAEGVSEELPLKLEKKSKTSSGQIPMELSQKFTKKEIIKRREPSNKLTNT